MFTLEQGGYAREFSASFANICMSKLVQNKKALFKKSPYVLEINNEILIDVLFKAKSIFEQNPHSSPVFLADTKLGVCSLKIFLGGPSL